jgi:hypothetical protein
MPVYWSDKVCGTSISLARVWYCSSFGDKENKSFAAKQESQKLKN